MAASEGDVNTMRVLLEAVLDDPKPPLDLNPSAGKGLILIRFSFIFLGVWV